LICLTTRDEQELTGGAKGETRTLTPCGAGT
jgi:hypothetical protein